ncbi:hypothetical protein KEM48_006979 [Puccinia striiformis f. sp. tritici PST-130]|nr:hypothetical protein KEM48_006979 [Puccinia striiformis f. sp. tritici PST-130]
MTLDRLLLLLDTGSTPSVRLTAARQLGQIAAQTIQHSSVSVLTSSSLTPNVGPSTTQSDWRGVDGEWQEIVNLLGRILPYLRSKSWETRQAASEAVDAICKAVGIWDPSATEIINESSSDSDEKLTSSTTQKSANQNTRPENWLTYQNFNLDAVLSEGLILLASAGKEFDYQSTHLRSGESLIAAQRDVANKLGLGVLGPIDFESMGVDDPVHQQQQTDQTQNSSQVSTPTAHRPPGITPAPIDSRQPSSAHNESHPSATPGSEAAGLSTLGLSQSPRSNHQLSQVDPTMRLPQLPATVPTSEAEVPTQSLDGLSARERNALKRNAKLLARETRTTPTPVSSSAGPSSSSDDPMGAWPYLHLRIILSRKQLSALKINHQPILNTGPALNRQLVASQRCRPFSNKSSPLYYKEGEWPFTSFVEILMIDLFSSQWEFRHGAALTLIPLLKIQGSGAAKSVGAPRYRNSEQHQSWMEDIGLRLICLLSLDRFGDYVGDQVIAPVRETAAQAISFVGRWLDQSGVQHMLSIFHQMVEQKNVASHPQRGYAWQVRHAGLLGMKYLVAVKNEMLRVNPTTDPHKSTIDICMDESTAKPDPALEPKDHDEEMKPVAPMSHDAMDEVDAMPSVKPEPHSVHLASGEQNVPDDKCAQPAALLSMITSAALTGLRDQDDDVRAAASGALLPVTDLIVELLPTRLNELLGVLWDALANLITYPTVLANYHLRLVVILSLINPPSIPLFPTHHFQRQVISRQNDPCFSEHGNVPVREWVDDRLLRLTFQNLLVEERSDIRAMSHQVWIAATSGLLNSTQSADLLLSFIQPHLSGWFDLMTTPRTRKLNASLFYTATRNAKLTTTQDIAWYTMSTNPSCLKIYPSITVENWAEEYRATSEEHKTTQLGQIPAMQPLSNRLRNSSLFAGTKSSHAELDSLLAGTRRDIEGLLATFASLGKVPTEKIPQMPSDPFTIEHASHVVNNDYQTLIPLLGRGNKKTALASLEDRRRKLLHVIGMYESDKVAFDTQIDAAAAAAVVALREIPGKISPVIKGFTQSIKNEPVLELQTRSANALASFIDICTSPESPPPISVKTNLKLRLSLKAKAKIGIFSAEDSGIRPQTKNGSTHRDSPESESASAQAKLLRRGAELALSSLAARFGDDLIDTQTVAMHVRTLADTFTSGDVAAVDSKMEDELTVDVLSIKILAYIIFLVVPVLGRMSDPDDDVRHVATHTFACLIKLCHWKLVYQMIGFPPEMLEKRQSERQFLSQLLGGSKIEEYDMPIKVKADLRKYQRDGISWLAFLAKYQLHGILCDDMGLGKTLQSICILASKHQERAELHTLQPSPSTVHLPSLVVCPPTLTGHWAHEIRTYAPNLKPLLYVGGPPERLILLKKIKRHDVVILSYDIVRNDIERLSKISWNYCILDEGHIIKNAKSKLSQAVNFSSQPSSHSLRDPIQNNALELWSLFDFLMPGFLGTEKYFNDRFGRPISASRDAKSSSKEQEAGALALEALHKQMLDDLPPKIIQDYYCELSPIQKRLYEDFSNSQAKNEAEVLIKGSKPNKSSTQHVFQALQYLKKLVNHPALVLRPDLPQHQPIISKLGSKGLTTSTHLIETVADDGGGTTASGGTIPQHRVLIFCQMKQMLDIIEHDLFKLQMPNVTYMRMDGSTDATKRHDVVQTFNSDPSIDCLLLTTHVGGLGLNLTGADTVIFVEHDWNPMKDLQAMDRAHRLGQKKVVNVYRLITRATLEEKIMGLQRFKMNIATSIVNQQNSNLGSLNTDEILDLFNISSIDGSSADPSQSNPSNSGYNGMEGQVGRRTYSMA